jgi:hypothetical protein
LNSPRLHSICEIVGVSRNSSHAAIKRPHDLVKARPLPFHLFIGIIQDSEIVPRVNPEVSIAHPYRRLGPNPGSFCMNALQNPPLSVAINTARTFPGEWPDYPVIGVRQEERTVRSVT